MELLHPEYPREMGRENLEMKIETSSINGEVLSIESVLSRAHLVQVCARWGYASGRVAIGYAGTAKLSLRAFNGVSSL